MTRMNLTENYVTQRKKLEIEPFLSLYLSFVFFCLSVEFFNSFTIIIFVIPSKQRKTRYITLQQSKSSRHYIAGSASGQEETNREFWLATLTSKIELSCPLGISPRCPAKENRAKCQNNKYFIGNIMNHLLTKLGRSRWLDIGLVLGKNYTNIR